MFVSGNAGRWDGAWNDDVLAHILAPTSVADFMAGYWSDRPLYQAGDPGRFAHLLTSGDIEFLATSLVTLPNWISFVRDGTQLPLSSVTSGTGMINAHGFRQAWASGFTVLLPSVHCRWPAIGALCRAIEGELTGLGVALSRPIIANAYASPTQTRGFKPHYDDHEVLVLQLEGQKRWRVFEPKAPSPLKALTEAIPEDRLGPPLFEALLSPGDMLYIPRGFPHDAIAVGGATLHLTLSIGCNTWLDLARSVLSQSRLFRANLPAIPGGSLEQGRAWSAELAGRLAGAGAGPEQTADLAARLSDIFLSMLQPAMQTHIDDLTLPTEIALETIIAPRPGSFLAVDRRAAGPALLYPGGAYQADPSCEAALAYIASHPTFAVRDLPGLPDQAKLRLAGELIAKGCLVVAGDRLKR